MASSQYLVTWGGTHRCCSALTVPCGNISVLLSSMATSAPAAWTSVQTHVQKIPLWVFIQKFCSFRLCILTLGSTLSWVLYVGFTLLCGYLVSQHRLLRRLLSPSKVFLAASSEMSRPQMPRMASELPVIHTFSCLSHTVAVTYAQMRNCRVSLYLFVQGFGPFVVQSCVFFPIKNSTGLLGGLHWL